MAANQIPPSAPVGVDAPGSRAWMAEVCRAAALSLAAHGVRNDQLSKVADWITQQPAPSAPVVVEAIREAFDEISGLCRHLRQCGPAPEDLQDLSDALDEAVGIAANMLHTLAQQPTAVDEAAAIRAFEEHFEASAEDPSFEGELELWLTAWRKALSAQHQEPTT